MRRKLSFIFASLLIIGVVPVSAATIRADVPPSGTYFGSVTFTSTSIQRDARARRELDALVPALLKDANAMMVRLEGHAGSAKSHAEYIRKSLQLAQEVERYLRVEQKASLDLYLAAVDDKIPPRNTNYVRIIIYAQEFKERRGITQVTGQ